MSTRSFILLGTAGVTSTGAGNGISPQGDSQAIGAAPNNILVVPYDLTIAATGGTATVQIQTSPDDSTYTTVGTVSLDSTKPNMSAFHGCDKLTTLYLRLNVSAISGATVKGYVRFY